MYVPVTENEREGFFRQNINSFIPGYTGHCPTLRFHYGKSYGAKTKEIMQEIREKGMLYKTQKVLKPIIPCNANTKAPTKDCAMDKFPKYISGYTGFIPTLNFRYGKSYSNAAADSISEFSTRKRQTHWEAAKNATTKLTSIRRKDDVTRALKHYDDQKRFKPKKISPEDPPIAGYTGHIPRVKGNEESLSQRYDTVVRRGLKLLREEREQRHAMKNVHEKVAGVLKEVDCCN